MKGENRRIAMQLIDTMTNLNAWAQAVEGRNAPSLQDEAVRTVIVSLPGDKGAIRSNEYERTKDKATAELDEYGFFLRGTELMSRAETIADHDRGGAILREGLKRFPDSALLRAMLAVYHFRRPWDFQTGSAAADYRLTGEFARAALASQNPSRLVQWRGRKLMAYIHWTEGDFVRAVADAEAAVALNPDDADTLSFLSRVQIAAGNPARAIEWVQESTRLDPTIWRNTRILAWAYYLTGAYEQSIEAAKVHDKLTRAYPAEAYLYLAVDYVRLGRIEEARAAIKKLLEMEPQWTQRTEREWNATWPYKDSAVFERYLADLAQAGLPEK
jgi:adenylate cyclase